MYSNLFENAKEEIETTRAIIRVYEELRKLESQELDSNNLFPPFTELIKILPTRENWTMYEHCSVVTRLYSIYESFVESLIHEWIDRLPTIVIRYSELDERIRRSHAANIGELLSKMCNRKDGFKDESVKDTLQGLYKGINGDLNYTLLRNAFSTHEQNLRKDILEELFREAGIDDHCWAWVQQHSQVKKIVRDEDSAESQLKKLVEYRNEAAHGKVSKDKSNLLKSNLLLELCDFIETICLSLSELVRYRTLQKQEKHNFAEEIGTVKRFYDDRKVAEIVIDKETNISVGESIYLVRDGDDCRECQVAVIENIRIDKSNIDKQKAILSNGMKVKLELNVITSKNAKLYKLIEVNVD